MTRPAFDARIIAPDDSFQRNIVRLAVRDNGNDAYLMPDGTWFRPESEAVSVPDMGLLLPAASIEAIALAVQEWQGHTSHADTEARVLREWLTAERERVNRVLFPDVQP